MPDPSAETRRLAALHALNLPGGQPQREFDALVALAAEMLGCPAAFLNLVDRDTVRVASTSAPGPDAVPREWTMCAHAIRQEAPLVVPDLALDPRFTGSPLVTQMGMRFYAGAPIGVMDDEGERQAVGALCVIDPQPRLLDDRGRRALVHLASLAEALLAARRSTMEAIVIAQRVDAQAAALTRHARVFRQAERMASIGWWRLTLDDGAVEWSDGVAAIHGLEPGTQLSVHAALDHYPPEARARVSATLTALVETGQAFDFEEDFLTAHGDRRRVRSRGELERADGRAIAIVGVFQDVTEQYRLQTMLRRSAETDALTGIPNRAAFERALEGAVARARAAGTRLLLALVDLDGFKAINDTLGHLAGDEVLRGAAQSLHAAWLGGACAARIGGDEFAVVVEDRMLAADAGTLAARIEAGLRLPVTIDGVTMLASGTVGVAALEADDASPRDLVRRADALLYAAKRARVGERRRGDRRAA